jgi:ribosomal-protein-alanine N-acetyltransferase
MGVCQRATPADGMSITIESATLADLPAIRVIETQAFTDPWSERSFREAMDHPAVYFACARRDGGEVDGYVVAWFAADQGEIANLAVAPTGWGMGIGKALLDGALDEAARKGIEAVFLEVRDSNDRARRLYQSRGFEEVGRRRGYYRHPDEDAIVLRRVMSPDST